MHKTPWRLQDAKAQFSAVVDAALQGEPQLVTRRGKNAVVVVAVSEYTRLRDGERTLAPGFIEHLLAMPRAATQRNEPGRPPMKLRDVVLE
jgi:antitoxin Phd